MMPVGALCIEVIDFQVLEQISNNAVVRDGEQRDVTF
jgi:hypothetical protein